MRKVQAKEGAKGPKGAKGPSKRSKKVAKLVQFWIRLENVCKFIGVVMVLHDLDVVPDDTFGHLAPEALLVATLG